MAWQLVDTEGEIAFELDCKEYIESMCFLVDRAHQDDPTIPTIALIREVQGDRIVSVTPIHRIRHFSKIFPN